MALLAVSSPAEAAFEFFGIGEIYSNVDGSVQYVVARETTGSANDQHLWAGSSLVATRNGVRKVFTFAADLPSPATAGRSVLMATAAFAAQAGIAPDYTIPDRFLPTDGGTLDLANADRIALPPLPSDGVTALDRAGAPVTNAPRNFSGAATRLTAQPAHVVEYYNAVLDHYFISDLAPDIDALDSGRLAGWVRTGRGFMVFPSAAAGGAGVNPVCRILIPPPADSHFLSASPQECADSLARFPTLVQESPNVFYIAPPVTGGPDAGTCPAATMPAYRVYNNRADSNHRYTTDRSIRDAMVAAGGIAEGYGTDTVIMCAPVAPLVVAPDGLIMRFPIPASVSISGGAPPYQAVSSNAALVAATVSGSTINLTPGLIFIDTPVTIAVADASGQHATIAVILIEP